MSDDKHSTWIKLYYMFNDFWAGNTTIAFRSCDMNSVSLILEWRSGAPIDHREGALHVPATKYLQLLARMDNFRGVSADDLGNPLYLRIAKAWWAEAILKGIPWHGPPGVETAVPGGKANPTSAYGKSTNWMEAHWGMVFALVTRSIYFPDPGHYVTLIRPVQRDAAAVAHKLSIIEKIWHVMQHELGMAPSFDPKYHQEFVWPFGQVFAPEPVLPSSRPAPDSDFWVPTPLVAADQQKGISPTPKPEQAPKQKLLVLRPKQKAGTRSHVSTSLKTKEEIHLPPRKRAADGHPKEYWAHHASQQHVKLKHILAGVCSGRTVFLARNDFLFGTHDYKQVLAHPVYERFLVWYT